MRWYLSIAFHRDEGRGKYLKFGGCGIVWRIEQPFGWLRPHYAANS
jgi:hypothetical protein